MEESPDLLPQHSIPALSAWSNFMLEPKYFEETDSAVDPSFFLENNLGIKHG